RVLEAAADFVDLKSPFFVAHSRRVAALAEGAARATGLGEGEIAGLRRAALVHDLGRVGVSVGLWDKPGPLTDQEWERARLHAYLTERMFARVTGVPHLAALCASDHERADGSGY